MVQRDDKSAYLTKIGEVFVQKFWLSRLLPRSVLLVDTLADDIVKVKGTQKYPFSSYKSPQCVVIVVVVVYI